VEIFATPGVAKFSVSYSHQYQGPSPLNTGATDQQSHTQHFFPASDSKPL